VDENITFQSLCTTLGKLHKEENFIEDFSVKYVDSEDDAITVSTTTELEEAFCQAKEEQRNPILRLTLTRKPKINVSDRKLSSSTPSKNFQPFSPHVLTALTKKEEYSQDVKQPFPQSPKTLPHPRSPLQMKPKEEQPKEVQIPPKVEVQPQPKVEVQLQPKVEVQLQPKVEVQLQPKEVSHDFLPQDDQHILQEHLVTLSDEVASKCVSLSNDMSRHLSNISFMSIATDVPMDSIYEACQQISAQCALLSAELTTQSNTICSQSVAPNFTLYSTDQIMCACNVLSEETNLRCNQVSNQINRSMEPLHQEIMSLCTRTSDSCCDSVSSLLTPYNEDMVRQLCQQQNALAQMTNEFSLKVSDNILAAILAI